MCDRNRESVGDRTGADRKCEQRKYVEIVSKAAHERVELALALQRFDESQIAAREGFEALPNSRKAAWVDDTIDAIEPTPLTEGFLGRRDIDEHDVGIDLADDARHDGGNAQQNATTARRAGNRGSDAPTVTRRRAREDERATFPHDRRRRRNAAGTDERSRC